MAMPMWARFALRSIGVLNVALAAFGSYALSVAVRRILSSHVDDPSAPYFRHAFWALTIVNVVFLVILVATAVRFIQLRVSAVMGYSISVAVLISYTIANGALWLAGHGIGRSIGSASGIGNMGIAPFVVIGVVPYLYPVASVVLLQVLRRRVLRDSFSRGPSE
ncbi:MAG: hypothetical protein WAQ52_09035 [Terriglobales bacterium]